MKALTLIVLVLFVATLRSTTDEEVETAAIRGEWQVISLETKGKVDTRMRERGMRYLFGDETWTTWTGSRFPAGRTERQPQTVKYTVDNSRDPRHLDIIHVRGQTSVTQKAIYKIQDGRLFVCLGRDQRPTTFDTTGTNNGCYIAERIPDGEGEDR